MAETEDQVAPAEVEAQAPVESGEHFTSRLAKRLRGLVAEIRALKAAAGSAPWDPEPELQSIEAAASELEGI